MSSAALYVRMSEYIREVNRLLRATSNSRDRIPLTRWSDHIQQTWERKRDVILLPYDEYFFPSDDSTEDWEEWLTICAVWRREGTNGHYKILSDGRKVRQGRLRARIVRSSLQWTMTLSFVRVRILNV